MQPEIRTVPWGSTIIKFPKIHFTDQEVQQAAQDVLPAFNTPVDCFVGLQRIEGQTVGRIKGHPNTQLQAFHDDKVESIRMVLRQVVAFLSNLGQKSA
jgi:hypothetical protein